MVERPRAVSIEEACERLSVCRMTLYTMIHDGKLNARKLGRRTVILEKDLLEFMEGLPSMRAA